MSASARLNAVLEMLRHCAPGHTVRLANHSRVIKYNGKCYRSLPKFEDLQIGHLRQMVRVLEIDKTCATQMLPGLFKIDAGTPAAGVAKSAKKGSSK